MQPAWAVLQRKREKATEMSNPCYKSGRFPVPGEALHSDRDAYFSRYLYRTLYFPGTQREWHLQLPTRETTARSPSPPTTPLDDAQLFWSTTSTASISSWSAARTTPLTRSPGNQHHLPCAPGRTRTNPSRALRRRLAPRGPTVRAPPPRPQRVVPVPRDGDTGNGDTGHPDGGHHSPLPSPLLPAPAVGGNHPMIDVSLNQWQRQCRGLYPLPSRPAPHVPFGPAPYLWRPRIGLSPQGRAPPAPLPSLYWLAVRAGLRAGVWSGKSVVAMETRLNGRRRAVRRPVSEGGRGPEGMGIAGSGRVLGIPPWPAPVGSRRGKAVVGQHGER